MDNDKEAQLRRAKGVRAEAGKTVREVAGSVGIDFGSLSKFENGLQGMSLDRLGALATYYSEVTGRRVTVDELIGREAVGVG